MIAEPYKVKEVKKLANLLPYERAVYLREAGFNTFRIRSDLVTFDMIARGMSAWSHDQKAGYMIGDEAYAGSRNYNHLRDALARVLGIEGVVPAHNRIGAEKLIATTMLKPGQVVLHNYVRPSGLVLANGGRSVDVGLNSSGGFCSDFDLGRLQAEIEAAGPGGVAWVHAVVCPFDRNGVPMSFGNLDQVRQITQQHGIVLVVDVSDVFVAAAATRHAAEQGSEEAAGVLEILTAWVGRNLSLLSIARGFIKLADIVILDGSQEARSDVGAIVASKRPELHELLRNEVVVFEGLHSYGGMSGRAMEVFAVGVEEMIREPVQLWYVQQVRALYDLVSSRGVPCHLGGKGIALDASVFLDHLAADSWRKFVLADALYLFAGIRAPIDGLLSDQTGEGREMLFLEVPRCAYTVNHLRRIADGIAQVWKERKAISGLRLLESTQFADEASFAPLSNTFFPGPMVVDRWEIEACEPHKIAVTEPMSTISAKQRWEAVRKAGFNTFLLDSAEVTIDFLTDSGVPAMSCYQWEGMTNTSDSPFSSPSFEELVTTFRSVLGFQHIIPTHQGRAAEHIMSQVMIKKGQYVPGNMYFTTTKQHQEMAGGVFRDVIVDAAHDAESTFPWKGNIDLGKMEACVREAGGPEGIAYISYEMCVNLAGGQPFSMENAWEVSRWCHERNIPVMFDATRCVENAYMVQKKDPAFHHRNIRDILREMMSYGDGCTISCKKDFLVNMGGLLACNDPALASRFRAMLRTWEGESTNGGMDSKDMVALTRGLLDSLDDDYIRARVEATGYLGDKLIEAGIPIVMPPGSHAIFLDARRFLPHVDQDEFPAQALAAAIYLETGVRSMERGNVSKGRDPVTGQNYRPKLELVRLTIPRRVYTTSHMDYVVEGLKSLYAKRDRISGLRFTYEPRFLRFFQSRFETVEDWDF